jgi:hypothetical protein
VLSNHFGIEPGARFAGHEFDCIVAGRWNNGSGRSIALSTKRGRTNWKTPTKTHEKDSTPSVAASSAAPLLLRLLELHLRAVL